MQPNFMGNNYNPYSNPYMQSNCPNRYNPYNINNMTNNIIWVQGLAGAKGYQIDTNTNALLLDNENENVMYIKSVDNVGKVTLRCFKYEEVQETPNTPQPKYITIEEVNALINQRLEEFNNGKQSLHSVKSKSTDKSNA